MSDAPDSQSRPAGAGSLTPPSDGRAPRQAGWRHWFLAGGQLDDEFHGAHPTYPWYRVLWLTGVDYFSTLGYQPGMALLAAGMLAPVATALLVLVTLTCALPIYMGVARRSFVGQGSIALLESLLHGWSGKLLVLGLIGFAATDFVITMTLSAADAAEHIVHNPFLHPFVGEHQILLTLALLTGLALVFLVGFSEAIGLAILVGVPYILLNLVVLGRGLFEITAQPELFLEWRRALTLQHDWQGMLLAAAIIFPRLALGLSGFETGVSVMPLVRGDAHDAPGKPPLGRIRNTGKLLATAAVIMSCMLLLSSFVTTLLVPPEAYAEGGAASGRAIAFLAHSMLGPWFGSLYDLSTILILWFAGASAMAGLLHLIPRYLPRFGMAPGFVAYARPLVLVLFAINVIVTLAFRADVSAQGGAYATGVLVLMLSAAFAVALALWREQRYLPSLYCWLAVGVFAFTLGDNVHARPDGLIIASIFIVFVLIVGAVSRSWRSTELRVAAVSLADPGSERLWRDIVGKKVNLVPVRGLDATDRRRKERELREHYALTGPIAFLTVELVDNRSEFVADLRIYVQEENGNYHIRVTQAIAIANTIACVSELIDPVRLFLGLSRRNVLVQAARYLFLGEGETGMMVYAILVRHWEATPGDDVRPLIFLMSD